MASKSDKIIVLSAPSGAGKSTLVRAALHHFPQMAFSVSATTRTPRTGEVDGRDYYFLSVEAFKSRIEAGEFLEWEEVYAGTFYGTLKSEVTRILESGGVPIFDVDVEGGLNIKAEYGESALAIFIQPPSFEALRRRLEKRGTNSPEDIEKRLTKAQKELGYADRFDHVLVNDDLASAQKELINLIESALSPAKPKG